MLDRLTIRNYKSLHDVSIRMPSFFVIVGANAAGKTNFVDALEFMATAARSGLASAISEKGGYENICFRRQRRSRGAVEFEVQTRIETPLATRVVWRFAFRAAGETIRTGYRVEREDIRIELKEKDSYKPYLEISRTDAAVEVQQRRKGPLPGNLIERLFEREYSWPEDELLVWTVLRGLPLFRHLLGELSSYRVFQISPGAARRPGATSGNQELGKFGENLPAALEWLARERKKESGQLLDYLRLAVPSISKIETDYVETRELGLFLHEAGMRRRLFSSELSDGTLRTLAMFLPLVDPRHPLVAIEEPENNVHPWVVRHFVSACRSRSEDKQIVLTTHSPVLVSQLKPEELYVADRDKGETRIYEARKANVELDEIIAQGIQDLGSYWDSGAMRAVPTHPQFDFMREASR